MTAPDWTAPAADPNRPYRIEEFTRFAASYAGRGLVGGDDVSTYDALWAWSVEDIDGFWSCVAAFLGHELPGPALAEERMPGAVWFPQARVNYARAVLDGRPEGEVAVLGLTEDAARVTELTWGDLRRQVAGLAATYRELGVEQGDRVVGFLPNTPEAIVGFLAAASIGATWAVCGMDYAASAAKARFDQLEPKVLLYATGYQHGGRERDRSVVVEELRSQPAQPPGDARRAQ